MFPDLPAARGGSLPVLGVATGIAGCLAAGEAIKLVTGSGEPITDGYLVFSVFSGRHQAVPAPRDPSCQACGVDAS